MRTSKEKSAGLLMWDDSTGEIKILLVHPGGPYFKNKDEKYWGIPKGLIEPNEDALTAAIREFQQETGIKYKGEQLIQLDKSIYKSGKVVYAWVFKGKFNGKIKSNYFEMEWPPKSGQIQSFPEVDRGEMFTLDEAMKKIMVSQETFINQLKTILNK